MCSLAELPSHTLHKQFVGVNFKENSSLSERYDAFLSKQADTEMVSKTDDCLIASCNNNALLTLGKLSERHGFSRCAGRLFAANLITQNLDLFHQLLESYIPPNSRVRLHSYPAKFARSLLDTLDQSQILKERAVAITPTSPTHLLTVLCPHNSNVYWGLYTEQEYRQYIARPGDGDRDFVHEMNFNKAQGKIAEALQMLTTEETEYVLSDQQKSVVVDVGAAPGGWTQYLANLKQTCVIAIDPGELGPDVLKMNNVRHIRLKAEDAIKNTISTTTINQDKDKHNNNNKEDIATDELNNLTLEEKTEKSLDNSDGLSPLENAGRELCGLKWRDQFRLLVCDANLDVRDSVRELLTPLALCLAANGVAIITLKLGRRVGQAGVIRKTEAVAALMVAAGFDPASFRVVWLFNNSKNERTFIARKF